MIINGCIVTEEKIELVYEKIEKLTNFTNKDVNREFGLLGFRNHPAVRVVQRWKEEGKIFYDRHDACWRHTRHRDFINKVNGVKK